MLPESEPHFKQPLLKTPFHERARALEPGRQLHSVGRVHDRRCVHHVEQEYFAIRNATLALRPDADGEVPDRRSGCAALSEPADDARHGEAQAGRVAYSVWCNDAVISSMTAPCSVGRDEYRLCTAERQLDWLLDSAIGFDVEIAEVTEEIAALAVQGPTSCAVLKAAGSRASSA
jgi:aminomethyltransferase